MPKKRDYSKYKKLQCKVASYEWDRFKDLESKGVTVRDVFEAFCDKCNGIKILIFKDGVPIEIPSNILSKRK